MTKTICSTRLGTCSRFTVMTSSSPSPAPVRLSPEWTRPWPCCLPKKMQSHSFCLLSSSTADTSKSTLPLEVSQPKAVEIFFSWEVLGRSTTAPFSMLKAALMRLGALGMTERTKFPITGSRMSMKCRPSCAGSSMTLNTQPFPTRSKAPTRSTSSSLFSSAKFATWLSCLSTRIVNMPFFASFMWQPPCAARTIVISPTSGGSRPNCTQTISS
mmetsp:Transcript_79586/g.178016  ORF Transcript_79586/g.178016 Transcript_79586/m.178016 type:complete len:214 (+) Transcript_79586:462-1103(+)